MPGAPCLATDNTALRCTSPGASLPPQLSGWRKFNFRSHPRMAGLRQRFPPPGLVFDGRPALSEAGFDLLQRLLEPCPVSAAGWCCGRRWGQEGANTRAGGAGRCAPHAKATRSLTRPQNVPI